MNNIAKPRQLVAEYIIDDRWVTASETRNYILGDPFADWVKMWWGKTERPSSPVTKCGPKTPPKPVTNTSSFIMNQGNIFETNILSELKTKFSSQEMLCIGAHHFNARDRSIFAQTRNAIANKVPIIYGGVLHNPDTKTYGVPDLIVRRDYLSKLFSSYEKECDVGPQVNMSSTYAIVDIKFTTIPLKSDGVHILNSGSFPAYKSQLFVYNDALSKIQNYENPHTYVLGRGIKISSKANNINIRDPFYKCGVISYGQNYPDESFIDQTRKAIEWVRQVKVDGWKWDPYKPEREEMYPNMCSSYDLVQVRKVKEKVARHIGEITDVWMCGDSARKIAHSNGVFSWKDKRCTAEIMGIKDGKISELINAVLEFNRQCIDENEAGETDTACVQYDPEISNTIGLSRFPNEFYVDFEIASDITADGAFSSSAIFMIGVTHFNATTNKKQTTIFSTTQLNPIGEAEVCEKFIEYLSVNSVIGQNIKLFHWSPVERWRWEKFVKETTPRFQRRLNREQPFEFIDLYDAFKTNLVIVNGCLNFKLKNIARRLHELGRIETTWPMEAVVADGLSAVSELHEAITSGDDNAIKETMANIESYNRIDVEVLYEIVEYMRLVRNSI
jgi:hypothetical protein